MSLKDKLLESCLFDESFYKFTYPDVKASDYTPLEHFLAFGVKLNRSPSAHFCSYSYLEFHSDVSDSGMSAIEHFLNFGKAEARQTFAFMEKSEVADFSNYCEGELESIYDGKVLKSRHFFIKGWVNSLSHPIDYISCELNGEDIKLYPDCIRRDLSTNKVLTGFNREVAAANELVSIQIKINVVLKTGFRVFWKELTLWFDEFDQRNYETQVLRITASSSVDNLSLSLGKEIKVGFVKKSKEQHGMLIDEKTLLGCGNSLIHHVYSDESCQCHLASFPVHFVSNENNILVNNNKKLITNTFLEIGRVNSSDEIFVNGFNTVLTKKGDVLGVDVSDISSGTGQVVLEVYRGEDLIFCDELFFFISGSRNPSRHVFLDQVARYSSSDVTSESKRSLLLLRRADSPTDRLYIEPFLSDIAREQNISFDILNSNSFEGGALEQELVRKLKPGIDIIVTRYIAEEWLEVLFKFRNSVRSITYVMDDDLLAAYQTINLPVGYRTRMRNVALRDWRVMSLICDNYVNTSTTLAAKYSGLKSVLMHPTFFDQKALLKADIHTPTTISYHATGGHKNDIDFLAEVIRKILNKHSNVQFKIVLGGYCPEVLKNHPQVHVFKNMTWEEYQAFIRLERSDIGLAPLLKTPYNEAKSIVKLIDIASLGAVGVFSDCESYRCLFENGDGGFIAPNEPTAWFKILDYMIENPLFLRQKKVESVNYARASFGETKNKEKWLTLLGLK